MGEIEIMKKGYYIYFDATISTGVAKKVTMQINEMNKKMQVEKITVIQRERCFLSRVYGLLPWVSNKYDYDELLSKIENPDFIYIRAILVDCKYIKFLQCIKDKYPNCKMVVEYPTYPYKKELIDDITMILYYYKDLIYQNELKKYVDRIVTFSEDQEIFGIPTIKIRNGIIVDEVTPIQSCYPNTDSIVLIAVAYMQKYHGYERLIRGLREYYIKDAGKRVELLLVGEGPELQTYKTLCDEYGLSDVVHICGKKEGEELDSLYDKADIAVATLGGYKIGIHMFSSLKTREYMAKGLPMVIGAPVDVFYDKDTPYYLEFPNDDSTIDVEKIVQFYDKIYGNKTRQEVVNEIREYAYEMVDMKKVLEPIVEYIMQDS